MELERFDELDESTRALVMDEVRNATHKALIARFDEQATTETRSIDDECKTFIQNATLGNGGQTIDAWELNAKIAEEKDENMSETWYYPPNICYPDVYDVGFLHGVNKGKLENLRECVLQFLDCRLGSLPNELVDRVNHITDASILGEFYHTLIQVQGGLESLEDVQAWLDVRLNS